MKWISKYDFFDFYKDKINIKKGDFLPTDDARFTIFQFLDKNTIFLGGSIPKIDSVFGQNNFGFIFISRDKGKSYQQILFPEENVTSLTLSKKYSLVETNSDGYSPKGKNCIYLLDNTTLQYKKLDEYSSNNKIDYSQFNGEYVIYSNHEKNELLNVFTKEKYNLPAEVSEKNFILNNSDATITFLKENSKIVIYNAKDNSYKVSKELKGSYSTIMNTFGEIYLGKTNLMKTSGTAYDLNEKELFTISPKEEKGRYRYKNFACQFIETRPYVTFRYSYDYGKNWYEYKTDKIFTTSTPKGYYKDEFMVMDVGFYDRNDNSHIMIGEFQK